MAKKKKGFVKIATIGAQPQPIDVEGDPEKIVAQTLEYWRGRFEEVLPEEPDLIVTPECCDRLAIFPPERLKEYYRVRGNRILDLFVEAAKENNCYIVYSADRQLDDGSWRNSSLIIDRAGNIAGAYDKNHLLLTEINEGGKVCGKKAAVVDCDFGRVGFAICFDLNIDKLRLQYVKEKPDLIIFPSMFHGGLMQGYWAYSCRCHFVSAIGSIGAVAHSPSQIRNPAGEVLAASNNYRDSAAAVVNLDCCLAHLDLNQDKFKAMKEKYGSEVKIIYPAYLGSVLISSEHETISVEQMVKEFEIELLDDYFKRSLAAQGHSGP